MCAWHLHIGMTWEQYWQGDPWIAEVYREKSRLDKDAESQKMWLMGLYNNEAFGVVVGNAFKGKGKPAAHYRAEPHKVTPYTEAEERAKEEKERYAVKERFKALKAAYERKEAREGKGNGDGDSKP